MLWFADHWGPYIPAALCLIGIGAFYVACGSSHLAKKINKITYTATALLGVICVFLPHIQRASDGATGFTMEYLGYIALATVGLYPYMARPSSDA